MFIVYDIFDEEKVEDIKKKKKHKEQLNKKKLLMVKKPTNIILVINMKNGISLKFKDYHPEPAIAT